MPGLYEKQRVLIIDDEVNVSDTLGLIFTKEGYEARVAHSAEEAIELIAIWAPDLAIIDVILPGMNGIDFALVLRANHPGCQLLLFSGWLVKSGADKFYRAPAGLPPWLGLPDALTRLAALAYPRLAATAWVAGGALVLAGLAEAWKASRALDRAAG